MRPEKLTARVAPHIDAIDVARRAGITWREIAKVLEASSVSAIRTAVWRARRGVDAGRYVVEQMPLPEPAVQRPEHPVPAPRASTAAEQHIRERLAAAEDRPLPGSKRSAEDMRAELEASGIPIDD